MQGQQRRTIDLERHHRKLLLLELKGADRPAELDPLEAVFKRRFEARTGGSDGAPNNPISSFVQAGQRSAQSGRLGQHGIGRQAHIVKKQL